MNKESAFPTTEQNGCNSGEPGISVRDYFAAKAPVTIADAIISVGLDGVSSIGILGENRRREIFKHLALLQLEYADAMLAAREA